MNKAHCVWRRFQVVQLGWELCADFGIGFATVLRLSRIWIPSVEVYRLPSCFRNSIVTFPLQTRGFFITSVHTYGKNIKTTNEVSNRNHSG